MTDGAPRAFETFELGLGVGHPAPPGWQNITDCCLVILVGVTGVGKSTLLSRLVTPGEAFTLLPDRRALTDRLIIAEMQVADGLPMAPVRDRKERFDYTRRYRAVFPGGMAQALTKLWVYPNATAPALVFDGLRGANEVAYAATHLPRARFVMLDAPDWERIKRLLGRNDDFDHIASGRTPSTGTGQEIDALDVHGADSLFTPTEMNAMLEWVHAGQVRANDLRAKLLITIEERKNYDPSTTLSVLREVALERTIYIDTVSHSPEEAAAQVTTWLGRW